MDGGADALNGTIWFPNTPSPPYEQLSPVRQNRCDPIATQHVSFAMFFPWDSDIISLVRVERDASRCSPIFINFARGRVRHVSSEIGQIFLLSFRIERSHNGSGFDSFAQDVLLAVLKQ